MDTEYQSCTLQPLPCATAFPFGLLTSTSYRRLPSSLNLDLFRTKPHVAQLFRFPVPLLRTIRWRPSRSPLPFPASDPAALQATKACSLSTTSAFGPDGPIPSRAADANHRDTSTTRGGTTATSGHLRGDRFLCFADFRSWHPVESPWGDGPSLSIAVGSFFDSSRHSMVIRSCVLFEPSVTRPPLSFADLLRSWPPFLPLQSASSVVPS